MSVKLSQLFVCVAGALAGTVSLSAQTIWSGLGSDENWTTGANWQGGVAPANNGTAAVEFRPGTKTFVFVDSSQSVNSVTFDFTTRLGFGFYDLASNAGTTLAIGSGGLAVRSQVGETFQSAGRVWLLAPLEVVLNGNQIWQVDQYSGLEVEGRISGTGQLALTGDGDVHLSGDNTYSGGTVVNDTKLFLGSDTALGTGAITFSNSAVLGAFDGPRTIANAINLNASVLSFPNFDNDLRFTGAVTLGSSPTLSSSGGPVFFDGNIGETGGARFLSVSGYGAVILSGANSYTGGSASYGGALIFRNANSVPATGLLSSSSTGYIGIGFNSGVQSGFLNRFDKPNAFGAIGFDTDPAAASPTSFAEAINLTGFASDARLGSSSRAILTSTADITPQAGAGYRFGGGGGTLWVDSALTGANSLTLISPEKAELTLHVGSSSNTYSGATSATHGAIVFGSSALSSGSVNGSFQLGTGGYIGTMNATLMPTSFIAKFSPTNLTGMIGFDSVDRDNPRTVGGVETPIDLSAFTETSTSIALGTATGVRLTGTIILPPNQPGYIFGGYKGGWLQVDSILSGSNSVRIGDYWDHYPAHDPNDPTRISTVFLNGANTHSGGTSFYTGRLVLGHASALGSGTLYVNGGDYESRPRLETLLTTNPTFSTPLVVEDSFAFSGVNPLTWAGAISNGEGTGEIWKHGSFNLTLTGNNSSFSGGFYIAEGTITFASNTAAGTGGLDFGMSGGIAAFTSASPSIGALESDTTSATVSLGAGTQLTIDQSEFTHYSGAIQGGGSIVKAGTGHLRLESNGTYTGGTTVTAGTLEVATSNALGTGAVSVNGAGSRLLLSHSVTLANGVSFGANGGAIGGNGTFGSAITVPAGSAIAPGHSVGEVSFASGLTWGPSSFYVFEVQDATAGAGMGWDSVQVTGTLTFSATMGSPFTLKLLSLGLNGAPGAASNFNSANNYAWTIASATGGIVGFDSAAVLIDQAGFLNSTGVGSFGLSVSGNNLMLNFTAVPEPSTWALLITGAGVIVLGALRRRARR